MGLQQGLSELNGWRSCAYVTREKSVVSPEKNQNENVLLTLEAS